MKMVVNYDGNSQYLSRYNILFDKTVTYWCSFKPKNGAVVYPCYACRDMFSCKSSFLDHVNRRGLMINFTCKNCMEDENDLTFYNPCSFLLHVRNHFSKTYGEIDLADVKISMLPVSLAGFMPHPNIPLLYDVNEDNVGERMEINTRVYSPSPDTVGKQLLILLPTILMFDDHTSSTEKLILKQISSNIPYCKFVTVCQSNLVNLCRVDSPESEELTIKCEPFDVDDPQANNNEFLHTEIDLPVTKIEKEFDSPKSCNSSPQSKQSNTGGNSIKLPKCPECDEVQKTPMTEHFLKENKPVDESLRCVVCKFIAPTQCSLKAHIRLHKNIAPFICPECGRFFSDFDPLVEHLDEVCFHLAKQVRYRCPAKNCGKIFAQTQTYSSHFILHMLCLNKCPVCEVNFKDKEEYSSHMQTHESFDMPQKLFSCTVCKGEEEFTEETYRQHIHWHCTDRSQSVYVYLCKFCRSYFRSTVTYASHLLRCTKRQNLENVFLQNKTIVTVCLSCNYHIKYSGNMTVTVCPRCGENLNKNKNNIEPKSRKEDVVVSMEQEEPSCPPVQNDECRLCDSNDHDHNSEKYSVEIKEEPLDTTSYGNDPQYSGQVEECSVGTPNEPLKRSVSPKSDDSTKRKRKRLSGSPRSKSNTDNENNMDLEPEEPEVFDGTYRCKLCDYKNTSRNIFQEHVILHRDISTSYQCMDCGECFLVKPTLIKHLLYYHAINDVNEYLEINSCYDKTAVKEMERSMKLSSIICQEAVAENQCKVCKLQFNDSLELSKHFRIHGMAFLLENQK